MDSHLNNGVNSRLRWTFNYGMKIVYDWKNAAAGCTVCEEHNLTGIINFRSELSSKGSVLVWDIDR